MTTYEEDTAHQVAWRLAMFAGGAFAIYMTISREMSPFLVVVSVIVTVYGFVNALTYSLLVFGGRGTPDEQPPAKEERVEKPQGRPVRQNEVPNFISRDGGYTRVRENSVTVTENNSIGDLT